MGEFLNKLTENLMNYVTTDALTGIGLSLLKIVIILILTKLALMFGDKLVDKLFSTRINPAAYFQERRATTLIALLKSVLLYVIYFIAIVSVLTELNVPVAPILAGAGVVSLAVGFGAQSLVKDVITGFFIIFEDQYSVGEYVSLGNVSGIVEEIGLRVTKLRDWNGELHIVPNGQVVQVTNFNRGSSRALVEVGVAYEVDIDKAIEVMEKAGQEVAEQLSEIIVEAPQVLGVVNFGPQEVILRMIARTQPLEQWRLERELRKKLKEAFDAEGIEIPYPKRVFIQEGNKNDKI